MTKKKQKGFKSVLKELWHVAEKRNNEIVERKKECKKVVLKADQNALKKLHGILSDYDNIKIPKEMESVLEEERNERIKFAEAKDRLADADYAVISDNISQIGVARHNDGSWRIFPQYSDAACKERGSNWAGDFKGASGCIDAIKDDMEVIQRFMAKSTRAEKKDMVEW